MQSSRAEGRRGLQSGGLDGQVRSRAVALLVVSAMAAMPRPARAQQEDRPSAELLFEEGRALLEKGKLDEACAKLEASEALATAVGTLLNLGECNERRGKAASAWSSYRAAQSLAVAMHDSLRADFARRRADAIQPRVAKLTVSVPHREPGMTIQRDGRPLEEGAWGTPLPVDPGTHVVEASAPGKRTETLRVNVVEGSTVVRVDPLAPSPSHSSPESPEPGAPAEPPSGTRTLALLGWAGIGLGVLGVGVSAFYAVRARNTWDGARGHCDASANCDPIGFTLNGDARRDGDISTIGAVAGGAFLAFGLGALFFDAKTSGVKSTILVGPHGGGIHVAFAVP
jgi:hypothetical protein